MNLAPMKGEDVHVKDCSFPVARESAPYAGVGQMDSTILKIFSVVNESFEKK
jgi:hypothetical protein